MGKRGARLKGYLSVQEITGKFFFFAHGLALTKIFVRDVSYVGEIERFILHRAFPRDFNREIRAQSETRLHREYFSHDEE